ncbi:hypothetical protein SAMN04515665_10394 [Blastococcus sp. DSM 46786]|uniref:hypothetical protein n=1 Tax=Blastococcus sp. DSM 46786 TaxID=1798227 RepID=UPI0008B18990|nr:hypothetical protein [Blastococcus sp. DSM 46786]SEK58073.1 hypothetical protein SAMN04515665_10394 [Blastococcus sp. DSM 46786]
MTTLPPTDLAVALDLGDLGDDGALTWLTSLDPTVLAVLGGALLVVLLITALAGWLVLRRVRRSPLVARSRELASRGRDLGLQGATAVAARHLPPGHRRSAAGLQLEVARARDRLRHHVATARAAGAHLGEIPELLPSLDAEGARLEQRLRQRALAADPADRADPGPEARDYLATVADVCDAVLEAERAVSAGVRPVTGVADAVAALRAHTSAYQELTAPPAAPPLPSPAPENHDRR